MLSDLREAIGTKKLLSVLGKLRLVKAPPVEQVFHIAQVGVDVRCPHGFGGASRYQTGGNAEVDLFVDRVGDLYRCGAIILSLRTCFAR